MADWLMIALFGGYGAYILSKHFKNKVPDNTIAKIEVHGVITGQRTPGSVRQKEVNPETIETLVEKALSDKSKGIIFEIDSPGGAVVPSKEIGDYVKGIQVPKVALVKGCAASGAYWIASACDKIIANEFSIVGSIGVIMPHISIAELAKKHGVEYDGVKAGKYKDMGNMFRPFTEEERKLLQEDIDATYRGFIKEIARNRNMEYNEVKKIAEGLIYSGAKAKKLGLVDQLGNQKEAIAFIEKKGNFKHTKVIPYKTRENFFTKLNGFARGMGSSFAEGVYETLSQYNKPELK